MIQVRVNFIEAQVAENGERKYDHFIFWEDNCAGQNKSSFNPVADLYCIQNNMAHSIATKFFKTGHSFMPPDQISGVINRHLSKSKRQKQHFEKCRRAGRSRVHWNLSE
jgi:hypothetical protein